MKIQIIVASTRDGRNADRVLPWLRQRVEFDGDVEVDVLDLRQWALPPFAETTSTVGDAMDPQYSSPVLRSWNRTLAEGDAYVVLTPEYNHSLPSSLKNAIDSTWQSFSLRNKPYIAVAYSVGIAAGARAVEHLATIAIESELVPLRNAVLIPYVGSAFTDSGQPADPRLEAALDIALEDLKWWSAALRTARRAGELPPAAHRRK
ncbi:MULTISPECIES: NADPH-dependent FMN reductase [Microbacterium]|uniref:NAD(P)H-dependent FMN reductase n=1 Tax=Microbacterium saccharophilum TaxID=1213358 RepID=A0A7Z7GEW5_9MICO|nr:MULTISPECIES: NAD(P)H-dependent oxidoreductase [Microbacterium]SFI60757.1 NAD(P)H-dependent FMN reductase [Microbacterium saccharophilum]